MKSLVFLLLLSSTTFASSPVVTNPELNAQSSIELSPLKYEIKVGLDLLDLAKDRITRKAMLLGLKVSIKEKFMGWSKKLEVTVEPSVDQQDEVSEFSLFIKQI